MNGNQQAVKQVGASGQISLGKEFAGRTVVIDSSEPGVWVIKTAQTIPDSELWLHQPESTAPATTPGSGGRASNQSNRQHR